MKKVGARHREIINMIGERETLRLTDFMERLHCSESTIRNDLRFLESRGQLLRVFGGATKTHQQSLSVRNTRNKREKIAIAQHALKNFIKPNMTVALDTGSTVLELANRILNADIPLTVITTSFHVAAVLVNADKISLNLVGGKYDGYTGGFYDENTNTVLRTMRSDVYFFSSRVACSPACFTIGSGGEVAVKQAMIACAKKTVALIDSSKIGEVDFKVVCGFGDVHAVVTDGRDDAEGVAELRKNGLNVISVPFGA